MAQGPITIDLSQVKRDITSRIERKGQDGDLSEEDSQTASDTSRGLVGLRTMFYGTPLEDLFTTMIQIVDHVQDAVDQNVD